MENAGSWTVCGSKEAMGVLKNLRKLDERNIARNSRANMRLLCVCVCVCVRACVFPPTFTSSILSAMFTGACGPPEPKAKPRFGAGLVRSPHNCEIRLFNLHAASVQRRERFSFYVYVVFES